MRQRRAQAVETASKVVDMKERMKFLEEDLQHLFDDQGIDESQYDDRVDFMDPITKKNTVQGYAWNIKMLKTIFAPTFQLHGIRQTGEHEVTTRWTMVMRPTFTRRLPLVGRWWDPRLTFTGTSVMAVNPQTGKFNRHIDEWDALEPGEQRYLSWAGVKHVAAQLGNFSRAPDLESPAYTILRKRKAFEVRRYEPFTVAETELAASTSGRDAGPAADGRGAFNALAGYIFGKNKEQQKWAMTTPVYTGSDGTMQFVVSTRPGGPPLPEPEDAAVRTRELHGGLLAARQFSGVAGEREAAREVATLRQALQQDGIAFDPERWLLARYNDPSTRPFLRRNEVLVPVRDFDVWDA